MVRAYLVSDLHLTSPDDPRSRLFLQFLQQLSDDDAVTHLILLGDIFDLWLGDHDYFRGRYRPVVDALVALQKRGVEMHYFEGNHDLHLDVFWERDLGFHVHPQPVVIELGGYTVRLEHGDQMDPDDRGYIFLRWFLRTPPMRWLILNLPGRLVGWIGERASAHSRTYTTETKSISADDAVAKIRRHAEVRHRQSPFDLIVSGHVHVRDDHRFETDNGTARSINLGTWLDRPCCLRLDDAGATLIELDEGGMAQSSTRAAAASRRSS